MLICNPDLDKQIALMEGENLETHPKSIGKWVRLELKFKDASQVIYNFVNFFVVFCFGYKSVVIKGFQDNKSVPFFRIEFTFVAL